MAAKFSCDLEDWNHALHIGNQEHSSAYTVTDYLLPLLKKYKIKGIFYILGRFFFENEDICNQIREEGHFIGSHGIWHDHWEQTIFSDLGKVPHRYPYWQGGRMPWPPSGGFFFRLMPIWYLKWAINKSGIFWLHPHDLDEAHPRLINPWLNWKRHINLKGSKLKLEKLLKEIEWQEASQ